MHIIKVMSETEDVIKFPCPECRRRIGVLRTETGKERVCPICKAVFRVPFESSPKEDSLATQQETLSETNPLRGHILSERGNQSDSLQTPESPLNVSTPGKLCPFCAEQIAQAAIKCKHCGEFIDQVSTEGSRNSPDPPGNSIKHLGGGRFTLEGSYEWGFDLVHRAMSECKVKMKEVDPNAGLLEGKCSHGINPFGITVTAVFHASGEQSIVELSARLTDAFDTFGVCGKKVQQITERVMENVRYDTPGEEPRPRRGPRTPGLRRARRPPSYANRTGPSYRGKALTGFFFSLAGLLVCGPAGIVGIIMTGGALSDMSTSNNDDGKGIAIAGLVIGFLAVLLWLMLMLMFMQA